MSSVTAQLVADWQRAELGAGYGRRPSLPTDAELRAWLASQGLGLDRRGSVVCLVGGWVGTLDRRAVVRLFLEPRWRPPWVARARR